MVSPCFLCHCGDDHFDFRHILAYSSLIGRKGAGFSLTPYLESFTPTFGLGTPVFLRICSNLHCGTPTFSKRCLWDSYFQNPSENPEEST